MKSGSLRARTSVASAQRDPLLPERSDGRGDRRPRLRHQRMDWPAGTGCTPPQIVDHLHTAVAKALKSEAVKKRMSELAFTPIGNSPAEFQTFLSKGSRSGAALQPRLVCRRREADATVHLLRLGKSRHLWLPVGRAPDEIDRLAAKRVFVIGTPSALGPVSPVLAQPAASPGSSTGPTPRPGRAIAEEARRTAQALGADACLVIGGGSAIGLGTSRWRSPPGCR